MSSAILPPRSKPIVVAMKEDRQKCLDIACDDYMTKAVDRDKLVAQYAEKERVVAAVTGNNQTFI